MLNDQPEEIILLVYKNLKTNQDKNNFSFVNKLFYNLHWSQNCKEQFGIVPKQSPKEIFHALLAINNPKKIPNISDRNMAYKKISEILIEHSERFPKEAWCFFYLAKLYWLVSWKESDFNQAKKYCFQAAELRYKEAICLLATIYRDGKFGFIRDVQKALDYFALAITLNYQEAYRELGLTYLEGRGCIKQDFARAIPLLKPFADNNDNDIALKLGLRLIHDKDLLPSGLEQALHYLTLAADRPPQNSKAAHILGCIFTDGRGAILKDDNKAKHYLTLACALGHKESYNVLRLNHHVDTNSTEEFEQEEKSISAELSNKTMCYIM